HVHRQLLELNPCHKKAQTEATKRHTKLSNSGEVDYKLCAARVVLFCADVTAVLQYCSLDDGQAESCAGITSRKIGFKKPPEVARLDALTGVCHLSPQQTSFSIVRRGDCELLFVASERHCCEGVVDQVYKDAFHLFDVEHGRGKIGIEVKRQPNAVEPFFIQARRLCNNVVQIRKLESRGGQTSKTRKLIHHRFEPCDFAADRLSTLGDHRLNSSIATTIRATITLRDPFC